MTISTQLKECFDYVSGSARSANQAGHTITTISGNTQTVSVPGAPIPNLVQPQPDQPYLIETDPKFTHYKTFISSDYLLGRLSLDPQKVQKRLGDGFYEQKLINDQIAELTGKRFLDGYASNEAQYKALMEAGVASAAQFQLTPGIALSAAQMAALTSDIVWLVEQEVTLPDGSRTKVLAPVVYLSRASAEDIAPTGALISGKDIDLTINGNLHNGGTLQASNKLIVQANDIANTGDIRSTGKDGSTILVAQNDILNNGGSIAGHRVGILAGRDVAMSTAASSVTGVHGTNTTLGRVASVTADQLSVQAGRDLNLAATAINTTGDAALAAGRDLNLTAVNTQSSYNATYDNDNHLYQTQTQVNGSAINARGKLALIAGQDINAAAAYANAGGQLVAAAGRDVHIGTAQQTGSVDQATYFTSKGMLSSSSDRSQTNVNTRTAVGSTLSGDSMIIQAGRDIGVTGSNIVATNDVDLYAKNNVTISTAQNTSDSSYRLEEKTSGMFSSGGVGVTIGSKNQQTAQTSQQTTQTGSTIGSTDGNIRVSAGNAYTQTGSDVIAPKGDIGIAAKSVDITAATETMHATQDSKFKQSGVTVAVTNPVISAVQTAQQMNRAASQTSDGRMQVLAGAVTALSTYNAVDAVSKNPGAAGGVNVSVSLGSSKSQSHSEQSSTSAKGSNVAAGGNLNIVATGAGKDSNINVIGSNISAGNNAALRADGDINLQAAQNTYEQHSSNSSSSASVGVGYGTTTGFTVNASASQGKGRADGSDVSYTNTHVNAGNQLVIASGGDTNLKGATASSQQVIAAVGGNLNIESLQDTSTYDSKQQNVGVGVTIPIGPGAGGINVSGGKSKIDSNFQSVTEQSGIKVGDGGFDITVKGNTDLKGAVIASTDKAVQDAKNSFVTDSLTQSDIQNSASYSANSVSVTGGVGTQPAGNQGTGIGFGHDSGNASSTSQSGISGIAGNSDVRTGDKESGVGKIFDQAKVQKDIDAQTQITLAFSQQAPKAIGTFADSRANALKEQARTEPDPDKQAALLADAKEWEENGKWRIALHSAAGALSGGVAGALGAGATASAATLLTDLQNNIRDGLINAGVDPATANLTSQAIAMGTAAGMGALASGGSAAGAGMGLAVDSNNRRLHPTETQMIKDNAARFAKKIYGTDNPTQDQITAATAMLANTAQNLVDYNFGYDVPYFKQAEDFLHVLQSEYAAQSSNLSIGNGQYLFYATNEQKNQPWLNSSGVDKEIAGVIVKAPIKQAETTGINAIKRDPATSLPLDDEGRYSQQYVIDGKTYSAKYFPCPRASAGCGGQNMDMSDPQTAAYIKALDKKVFDDIGKGATLVAIANPLGALGAAAGFMGQASSIASGMVNDSVGQATIKELGQAGAQKYLEAVFGLPAAAAVRITAIIDLAGGWAAFVGRANAEFVEKGK
ncbi:hemagglutinin repeat-containing protein [Collimonas silvisoli]|uniref:hemagglutinin repeat-containing protein n=1 Tax=Collimonas silvisoli TaxID=2825884 RepID=UPI001B8BEF1C|nr:hemagglutinin repeat-containing protein [Collimonas silvisoli]